MEYTRPMVFRRRPVLFFAFIISTAAFLSTVFHGQVEQVGTNSKVYDDYSSRGR
ncbi:uncharacterized protein BO66DRAFT_207177 [Aspergillus aculeatinus CBS 121060]|uniref:Uncharacterized protein n=1 Tax=Aspergillus aculeatinus CBS 121060 TaxID=1448322 RepID=A0ACD1GWC9_9EURO|nr:hypothetical protein BO66DRAFT_207177 [Aspergillus aculeatinus CBS 121060]RAH65645.1 hypothetical protein BO66DRAFT_207177 [Aspergillus aculeatinus CBS 121060]